MQRKRLVQMKMILLVGVFAVACIASDVPKVGERAMIRSILVSKVDSLYTIAALYQNPEAAADSSKAQPSIQLQQAEGDSVSAAFSELESYFLDGVSYKLCDSVVLSGQCEQAALQAYAQHLQTVKHGRLSAKLCYTNATIAALADWFAKDMAAAESFLEVAQTISAVAPRMYEASNEQLVLPVVFVDEEKTIVKGEQAYFLTQTQAAFLTPEETALYALLAQNNGAVALDSIPRCDALALDYTLAQRMVSIERTAENGAHIHLYAVVTKANDTTPYVIDNMEKTLASAVDDFIRNAYEREWDVLQLAAYDIQLPSVMPSAVQVSAASERNHAAPTHAPNLQLVVEVCLLPLSEFA